MKYIVVSFLILLFGCSRPSYIFVDEPVVFAKKSCNCSIAIKEVELPYYLEDAKVPYLRGNKIEFFKDIYFADDAQIFMTKRAESILKGISKEVYIYPWNSQSIDYIVDMDIKKLISDGDQVYITLDWSLSNSKKEVVKSSTCHDSITVEKNSPDKLLFAMQKLFDGCVNNIARKISGF